MDLYASNFLGLFWAVCWILWVAGIWKPWSSSGNGFGGRRRYEDRVIGILISMIKSVIIHLLCTSAFALTIWSGALEHFYSTS